MSRVNFSLHKRFTKTGTKSKPDGYSEAQFSLPSTINWMRSMALVVKHDGIDSSKANTLYAAIPPRSILEEEENTIFEQLLFSLHECSALRALKYSPNKVDVARIGAVSWYYGIYTAASAMITAQNGSFQNNHTSTAQVWGRQTASRIPICTPFDARISSLVRKTADEELNKLSGDNRFSLIGKAPSTIDEARAGCHSYLSGSVDWWREKTEENIKNSKEFRKLEVPNFRTKQAKELRDKHLCKKSVAFLHQAIRYRGKAQYRDSIFLAYGNSVGKRLSEYIDDLSIVLEAFVYLSGIFCSKRLGSAVWDNFLNDLEAKRAFSLAPISFWKG